jgi:hypothetical protein
MGPPNTPPPRPRGFIEFFVIGALLLVLAIIGAIWFLINAGDESLNPKVRAVLDAKHDSISPEDNLFFAILAFDAQTDADIARQGQELYASYVRARRANPQATFDFKKDAPFARQSFIGDKDVPCARLGRVEDCIECCRVRTARRSELCEPVHRAELTVEHGAIVLRKPQTAARAGWAEAAQSVATRGEDALLMGDFANAEDLELEW